MSPLPVGVILAGGRGRRFGGVDKSFLELRQRPLIEHVIARIAPQVGELLINTNSADGRYRLYGAGLCGDAPRTAPATGPLIGLTSAIAALENRGDQHSCLLSVPVDTPFLPGDLVSRLSTALAVSEAPIAYAATTERDHPIVALWGPKSRHPLRQLFDCQPNISLHALMAALDAERVVFAHRPTDPFFNINSPQDLWTALSEHRQE